MTDNIYKDLILDHYQNPKNFGALFKPTIVHEEMNAFCGDKIRMELKIDSDKIAAVAFSGEGCVISVASASLLTEHIKGKRINEIKKITKENVSALLGIALSPTRLKCAWLSWEVLQIALNKYTMTKGGKNYGKI